MKKLVKKAVGIATKPVSSTLKAFGTSGGKLGRLAARVESMPDRVTGKALETIGPVIQKALQKEFVTKADHALAKKLGWKWLEGRTAKTAQSTARASESLGNFLNSVAQGTAKQAREGNLADLQAANRVRLEADRAHVRTNSYQDIQKGLQSGMFKVGPDGDVYDRYGGRITENGRPRQGLAQRTATAAQVASIVVPALAPVAAAASAATAARHGVPVGKAIAQGALNYYAGQLGGKFGGQWGALGSHIGRGAASGAAGSGIAAYNAGARGGDLFKETARGGLYGGALGYAGGALAPSLQKSFQTSGLGETAAKGLTGATLGAGKSILKDIVYGRDINAEGALGGAITGGTGAAYGKPAGTMAGAGYQAYLASRRKA